MSKGVSILLRRPLVKDARALLFQQVPSFVLEWSPSPQEWFSLRLRSALGVRDPSLGLRSPVLGPLSRPHHARISGFLSNTNGESIACGLVFSWLGKREKGTSHSFEARDFVWLTPYLVVSMPISQG